MARLGGCERERRDISVLVNDRDGGCAPEVVLPVDPDPNALALADLRGTGKLDVAVAHEAQPIVGVLENQGDGGFGQEATYGAGDNPVSIAAGALQDGGYVNLVVANATNSQISVLPNYGDGTFLPGPTYVSGPGPADQPNVPSSVALGDINGDGFLDVVVTNSQRGTTGVLLNHQDGTFGASTVFPVGNSPWSVAVGDVNRDGRLDLVVANRADGTVSVLLSTCAP